MKQQPSTIKEWLNQEYERWGGDFRGLHIEQYRDMFERFARFCCEQMVVSEQSLEGKPDDRVPKVLGEIYPYTWDGIQRRWVYTVKGWLPYGEDKTWGEAREAQLAKMNQLLG